jgi:hypothetical protein
VLAEGAQASPDSARNEATNFRVFMGGQVLRRSVGRIAIDCVDVIKVALPRRVLDDNGRPLDAVIGQFDLYQDGRGRCSEATMKAIMGHMSRAMLDRYLHIRRAAKIEAMAAVEARSAFSCGLLQEVPKVNGSQTAKQP